MASFAVRSSFCLFVAFFCFTLNVEARAGKLFFSKFTHLGANKEVGLSPTLAPASQAPAPAPGPALVDEHPTGDGYFGPGSGMIPQTKESWPVPSTISDEEFDKLLENFDNEKGYVKKDNPKADEDKVDEDFEEEEVSKDFEESNEQKGEYQYNEDNNNEYTYSTTDNYKNNNYNDNMRGYGEERQGMSDTRFMENGNYFTDVKGETYGNSQTTSNYEEKGRGRGKERQGMIDTRFMDFIDRNTPSRNEGGAGARENYHPYEFDTMDEYYKSLEGSEESMP